MPEIIIYSSQDCPQCALAKNFLKNNNINYKEFDVVMDEIAAAEVIAKTGQRSLPVIIVNDRIIVGFDEERLKEVLKI